MKFLKFQKAGRKAVVAIKLNVVEGRSDAEPAWHGGRLCAANTRYRDQDDISQAQGFTDEDNLKLNGSTSGELLWRKEENAGRADVPGHKSDGLRLRHAIHAAETQREAEGGAGIFPLLRMRTHNMRWDANETARLVRTQEWRQT
ncbi:MAG: hypothetical protein WBB89_05400 [Candidatus Acidiferrum sp.]